MTEDQVKSFEREVEDDCTQALTVVGFKERKRGILTLPAPAGFQGWLGLNTATKDLPEAMQISPVLGIRADEIHKLIAQVEGDKYHAYLPPTVSTNLGYLTPQASFLSFTFQSGEKRKPVAERLADQVRRWGVPYIYENASLADLVKRLPREAVWEDASERLLAAYYLLGWSERQLDDFIKSRISQGKSEDRFWRRFEAFAEKFQLFVKGRRSPRSGASDGDVNESS